MPAAANTVPIGDCRYSDDAALVADLPEIGIFGVEVATGQGLREPVLTVAEVHPYSLGERALVRFTLPGQPLSSHILRLDDICRVERLDTGGLNGLVCMVQTEVVIGGKSTRMRLFLFESREARAPLLRVPAGGI